MDNNNNNNNNTIEQNPSNECQIIYQYLTNNLENITKSLNGYHCESVVSQLIEALVQIWGYQDEVTKKNLENKDRSSVGHSSNSGYYYFSLLYNI